MRAWSAVSTVAGALRKRVWIDQDQFTWTPSLYLVFVGPPGVITKSTTTDMSSRFLRAIPGIKFGPNNITWQALATAFAGAAEMFEWPIGSGEWHPMSPITLVSRELGSLLNPKDGDLVNLFIELYDGAPVYEKVTKMSGIDTVDSPWINMQGATTPSWIAENVPKSALGGGLISRIIFLYGDEKEKMVAYPKEVIKKLKLSGHHAAVQKALLHDLEYISTKLVGPFELTEEAIKWGTEWYESLWTNAKKHYSDDKVMGYLARKQTHMHKLAMILSASCKDELVLTKEDLQVADQMLLSVEGCLDKVFAQIGRTEQSIHAEQFIGLVKNRGRIDYQEAYRIVHTHFPDVRDFEGICTGAIRSGQVLLVNDNKGGMFFQSPSYKDAHYTPIMDAQNNVVKFPNIDSETKESNR